MYAYHTYKTILLRLLFVLPILMPTLVEAQSENDECTGAEMLSDISAFCSLEGAFTNENATTSPLSTGGSLSTNGKDVWFQFTAVASQVTITVKGSGNGGTLRDPEIQLVASTQCEEFLIIDEETDNMADIAELHQGGLIPGATYLIRVQGQNGREGTFQLCINNFFPPQSPGSDVDVASMLCNKSSFTIPQLGGAGVDEDEANNTCLDTDGIFGGLFGLNSEQSSTWFTWIAANDGTLEFTLTPLNPTDDLDFVLYELPNGVNNGTDRIVLRCMAAACEGPTGLNGNSQDLQEDANCDPGEDNFVKAIDMQEGRAYGLLINNFSESGNGFAIDFGGTGDFQGPVPAFSGAKSGEVFEQTQICIGEAVTFDASASSFDLGSITEYEWIFGVGAIPETANGANPGEIRYSEPGVKTIVLTVTTSLGCKVSEVREAMITVDTCCLALSVEAEATLLTLGESTILTTTATDAIGEVQYQWSPIDILSCTDCSSPTATPLETTTISVTVTDANGCEATDEITIETEIEIKEITIPNAFTPDFDGTNDRFTILGGGPDDRIISMEIYSRLGELVYEAANLPLGDSDRGWDGNYKGERQQPDVYIYHAVVLTEGEERAFTGDIMLIR